ncbi:hypothetical protein [Micromonospora vulcania]|uniref:Uncharacterized protein n=1 Tax=Micromonospora vulcania TaxID=1441873 RepID=A0ABW1HDK7_9ACTN
MLNVIDIVPFSNREMDDLLPKWGSKLKLSLRDEPAMNVILRAAALPESPAQTQAPDTR